MAGVQKRKIRWAISLLVAVCFGSSPAQAQYGGGTGEPNDPYQIATVDDLMLLGESPQDYDKHFILTADIDMDPKLPGRKVFDKAVIAPDTDPTEGRFKGTPFTGVFDGNGHTISHLTIAGVSYLGLFGHLGDGAKVSNLGLEDVDIYGTGANVGGLVGLNLGSIIASYSTGGVSGDSSVGGLMGRNFGMVAMSYSSGTVSGNGGVGGLLGRNGGNIATSYSTGTVTGNEYVGGLVGNSSWTGSITTSYSTGTVTGSSEVGGLAGFNGGSIATSYSAGAVTGDKLVGGLVGLNGGSITASCSTGTVTGEENVGGLVGSNPSGDFNGSITSSCSSGPVSGTSAVGGLVGSNGGGIATSYSSGAVRGTASVGGLVGYNSGMITTSFWDMETSGQSSSAGGTGLSTAEMQDINTYLNAGWDFVDEITSGTSDYWQISPGDYPRLRYHIIDGPVMPEELGTSAEPYLIRDAGDLGTVRLEPTAYYRLEASVDLSGITWSMAVVPWFGGTFDGNGHTISHLTIAGVSYLGLFGYLGDGAKVSNLGLEVVDINGIGSSIGSLAGVNGYGSSISTSYSTGTVSGYRLVGGLVGDNSYGSIATSYSTSAVTGDLYVGGLVGFNIGGITSSYSTGTVTGDRHVGGLVGISHWIGSISGITTSFWDMETSGQTTSAGGTGKATAEMQTASTFYGWIKCELVWKIDEGNDYPRLYWENKPGEILKPVFLSDLLLGAGTKDDPYLIHTSEELNLVGLGLCEWDKHFKLMADIDLSGYSYDAALIAPDTNDTEGGYQGASFTGVFGGNGHTISHLKIDGESYLGLFGQLGSGAKITNLGLEAVDVNGMGVHVGGIAGVNGGSIAASYITGTVTGSRWVGGLVGSNSGSITTSYSTGTVSGSGNGGGLVGFNDGSITISYSTGTVSFSGWNIGGLVGISGGLARDGNIAASYSTSTVSGDERVGGLVGTNTGSITTSYSTGSVSGNEDVGGLVGSNVNSITSSYSTGTVTGDRRVGGLVGLNAPGRISTSYSTGAVRGNEDIGGLAGSNQGSITSSYSIGTVTGDNNVGGLVGNSWWNKSVISSFWGVETSGQATSAGGTGKTTAEMQTAVTFLEAGWDFIDETDNGTEDIWWILEGQDYPRLWWEPSWERPTDEMLFIVVDDFESYNDLDQGEPESNLIWNTWIDGFDNPNNGSIVGDSMPPFVYWMIAHTGKQSMPYYYDNSGPANYSEATANVANLKAGQDWTKHGIKTLSLWFRRFLESDPWFGGRENDPEPMYVSLSNTNGPTTAVYHDYPNATQVTTWTEWRIDLQEFADQGVDLTNINTISIGFGYKNNPHPGGSGKMHFDDIRLYYRPAPQALEPQTAPKISGGFSKARTIRDCGGRPPSIEY